MTLVPFMKKIYSTKKELKKILHRFWLITLYTLDIQVLRE